MPSNELDLDRAFGATEADCVALRKARAPVAQSFEDYLRFLTGLGEVPAEVLRARHGPMGDQPFEL